ncbi:multiple epidermal growth factor-like domains 11 [Elysia marginata]|uniref:Multiple epidermal growth factor-like domains 11 n=1 Tax=Elysia marginata TaxID=1093978 RepID=A0AAV4JBT9_9GAST|nr:multiple epidermal growth factor-like domains 11 [Elysia marginata]
MVCLVLVGAAADWNGKIRDDNTGDQSGLPPTQTSDGEKIRPYTQFRRTGKLSTTSSADVHLDHSLGEYGEDRRSIRNTKQNLADKGDNTKLNLADKGDTLQVSSYTGSHGGTTKPVRLRDDSNNDSPVEHNTAQNVFFAPLSKRVLKNSGKSDRDKIWTVHKLPVAKSDRKRRRSHRQEPAKNNHIIRLRRRATAIPSSKTQPVDFGVVWSSLSSSGAPNRNEAVEKQIQQRKFSKACLQSSNTRTKFIKESRVKRDRYLKKRAALSRKVTSLTTQTLSPRYIHNVSCYPCSSSQHYAKFHDGSCADSTDHCPWCACTNKIPCDPANVTCDGACAYGWHGFNCLLSVCPEGKFAPYKNCSLSVCSEGVIAPSTSCSPAARTSQSCHPVNGECPQGGQTFGPNLYDACPRGTFGVRCHKKCHCLSGRVCQPMRGACPERVCAKKYNGHVCDVPSPTFVRRSSVQILFRLLLGILYLKVLVRMYSAKAYYQHHDRSEDE